MKVTDPKKPKDSDKHIGIEIELLSPFTRQECVNILEKDKFKSHIQIKGDSSIYSDEDADNELYECSSCLHYCEDHLHKEDGIYCHNCEALISKTGSKPINKEATNGHELNILFKEKDLLVSMKEIRRVLGKLKAHTNSSCGLHVHLDMRKRKPEECLAQLIKEQNNLFKLVKKQRRQSEYCKPTPKTTKLIDTNMFDRHYAINPQSYSKYSTLEVRMHHGTTDSTEMFWWIKTLLNVVDKKKVGVMLSKWQAKQKEAMKKAA